MPTPPNRAPAKARALEHPARDEICLTGVLHALADPMRLQVVRGLVAGLQEGMACGAFDLPVTKSTSTHHFRVLREAGVITQFYRGTAKMSVLRHDDLEALFPGLLRAVLRAAEAQDERSRGEGREGRPSPESTPSPTLAS